MLRLCKKKSVLACLVFIFVQAAQVKAYDADAAVLASVAGVGAVGSFIALLFNNNSTSNSNISAFQPYIGMQYGGGTIVNIDPTQRKLLIMANEDIDNPGNPDNPKGF